MNNQMSKKKELNLYIEYIKKIKVLIIEELKKESKNLNRSEDLLFDRFSKRELMIYKKIQIASALHGKIWELVFSNFQDFKKIAKLDVWSEKRKIYLELKNKSTTMNSDARLSVFNKLHDFKEKYPDNEVILGYVNDIISRDKLVLIKEKNIRILGGDSLFNYIFGDFSKRIRDDVVKIINRFYSNIE